jgi:hypothetical protein
MAPAVAIRDLHPGDRFHFEWNPERVAEVYWVGPGSATVRERHSKQVRIEDKRKGTVREFTAERAKPYQVSLSTRVHPAGRDPAWQDILAEEE